MAVACAPKLAKLLSASLSQEPVLVVALLVADAVVALARAFAEAAAFTCSVWTALPSAWMSALLAMLTFRALAGFSGLSELLDEDAARFFLPVFLAALAFSLLSLSSAAASLRCSRHLAFVPLPTPGQPLQPLCMSIRKVS